MARNRYDVDEVLEESIDINQIKKLGRYILPHKKNMAGVIFLMLLSSALMMLLPIFLQQIMDDHIPNADMHSILRLCFYSVIIIGFYSICLRHRMKTMSVVGQSIVHSIRYDLFTHLQELPFTYYDDRPHGKIQVRVVNYVNNLSDLLSNGIVNTITDLCNLVFILFFMLYLDVRLTCIALCGLPVLAIIVMIIKKKQRRAWQIQSNKNSNLTAYIAESINGIRVTQSFVRENENEGIFDKLSTGYKTSWMKAVLYNFVLGPSVDMISAVTTACVYILGIRWILDTPSTLTVGVLIAFTGYIGRFWTPINTLAGFYNSLLTSMSYLDRIFETMDEPVLVKNCEDAIEMPPIQGDVTFDHVTFSYEEGHKILDDISFEVKTGETYAIVGPTGAGKSTIVNLISRFYNLDSGELRIDGVDISKVTIKSLRSQMGIMMQDSFIFAGTIMDNIRYGKLDATDEEVMLAAKTVRAHDFIITMEHGYYSEVNERGSRLSAGQRQLISFARALLADPKILILDEATSSIDTETEMLLQEGLSHLLKGRTSFIIAHRLSTIKSADCIMYVDKRGIVEKGNHDELLKVKGEYYNLYLSQFDFLQS
ncbi:MAG: ABC transporter ATP-binding protein [Lachnospiraceae bacterium]